MPLPFSGYTSRSRTAALVASGSLSPHADNGIGGVGAARADAFGFAVVVGKGVGKNFECALFIVRSPGIDLGGVNAQLVDSFTVAYADYEPGVRLTIAPPCQQWADWGPDGSKFPSPTKLSVFDKITVPKSYPVGTIGQGRGLAPVTLEWNGTRTYWLRMDTLPVDLPGYVFAYATGAPPRNWNSLATDHGLPLTSSASLHISADSAPWGTPTYSTQYSESSDVYSFPNGFDADPVLWGRIVTGHITKSVGGDIKIVATDNGTNLLYNPSNISYPFSSCQGSFTFLENHKPTLVQGSAFAFADPYPGVIGIRATASENGVLADKLVVGQDPSLSSAQVEIAAVDLPGFTFDGNTGVGPISAYLDINTLDNAGDAGDLIDTQTGFPFGIGTAYHWPAISISHKASLPVLADSWVSDGNNYAGPDGNGGGASGSGDVVLNGLFKTGAYVGAYRYMRFTLKAQDCTLTSLSVEFQGRTWTLDPSDGEKEIDLCFAPTATNLANEDPGTTWPLVSVTNGGVQRLIPVDRGVGFGAVYDTKLKIVANGFVVVNTDTGAKQNSCAYSITDITVIRKTTPVFECLFGSDNGGYNALYYPANTPGYLPVIAKRGMICLVDGRIAAEIPVSVGLQEWNLLQMRDWLNAIPGFTAKLLPSGNPLIDNSGGQVTVQDIAAGSYWDGKKFVDQTTLISGDVTLYGSIRYNVLDAAPGQGDLDGGPGYGDASQPSPFRYRCHLRSKAWGCDPSVSSVEVTSGEEVAGDAKPNSVGYWETHLPYMRVPNAVLTYEVDPGAVPIKQRLNARVHVRARETAAVALETGQRLYLVAYATSQGLSIDRRWSSTMAINDTFTVDSSPDVIRIQLLQVGNGIIHCLYQRQHGDQTDSWLSISADLAETWYQFPSGAPFMANVPAIREVYSPRTRETMFFVQAKDGSITTDIYDGNGNKLGTWPQDEASIGSYQAPIGGFDAKFVIDGRSSIDVVCTDGSSYRTYRSDDDGRSWTLQTQNNNSG